MQVLFAIAALIVVFQEPVEVEGIYVIDVAVGEPSSVISLSPSTSAVQRGHVTETDRDESLDYQPWRF